MPRRAETSSQAPTETGTVFSDVSFMGRDTVAFSLRLRQSGSGIRPMGPSMQSTYLPELTPAVEEAAQESVTAASVGSDEDITEMMEDYDGCPEDHPDCNVREDRWEQIEELVRKDTAELQTLESVLFEAKSAVDAAKSKREIVSTRLEEQDDANLDKQTNVRKLKDEVHVAKGSIEEQAKAINKLQSEIDALVALIAEQERALANDGSRDSTRTEIVAPRSGFLSAEGEFEARTVQLLPRDLQGRR